MATDDNLDQDGQMSIDDLDTAVDEKLLMGDDANPVDDDAGDGSGGEDGQAEDDADIDELKKIAEDDGEGDGRATNDGEDKDEPIPKERFNQVYREMKALKEELKALKDGSRQDDGQQGETAKEIDIKALRKEATQALLDGETDKYEDLQGQIDEEIQRRAEVRAEQRIESRREIQEFKETAERLTEENPILNPETGNPKAIAAVVRARDEYAAQGMGMTEALKQAVADIVELVGSGKPNVTQPTDNAGEKKPDARNVTAINRGAKDSNRVPPAGGGVGNRAMDMPNGGEIPQDKWDNLPQVERDKILAGG